MISMGLYQHFKGNYFYVSGIAIDTADEQSINVIYSNALHPEAGVFTRPMTEFEEEINRDREDNVTGQIHRFEKVNSIENAIKNLSTQDLIEELKIRPDNPYRGIVEELSSRVAYTDYTVAIPQSPNEFCSVAGMNVICAYDNKEQALKGLLHGPKVASVYKRTYFKDEV